MSSKFTSSISVLASRYRTEACVICGHRPKKRARGVHICLDYLYGVVLMRDEEKLEKRLKAMRSVRLSGAWCLACVQKLNGRLDAALEELQRGLFE